MIVHTNQKRKAFALANTTPRLFGQALTGSHTSEFCDWGTALRFRICIAFYGVSFPHLPRSITIAGFLGPVRELRIRVDGAIMGFRLGLQKGDGPPQAVCT